MNFERDINTLQSFNGFENLMKNYLNIKLNGGNPQAIQTYNNDLDNFLKSDNFLRPLKNLNKDSYLNRRTLIQENDISSGKSSEADRHLAKIFNEIKENRTDNPEIIPLQDLDVACETSIEALMFWIVDLTLV